MQVLKLVYINHGWMLGLHQRPLFEEDMEAWRRYGPVVRCVYRTYARFRGNPIRESGDPHEADLDNDQEEMIDQVFEGYGRYTGIQLSELTHKEGSPWHTAWQGGMEIIPNDLLHMHYAGLAQGAGAHTGALHGDG